MRDGSPEFIDPAEDCPWRSPRAILAHYGYSPLPPNEIPDGQIAGRLWELIYAAAGRRIYFSQSDHLDDRGMYELLWERWLDEPTADIPLEAEINTGVSLSSFAVGGLTDEEVWLRYYVDEGEKEMWHKSDPDFVFPPHEDPPFDRDQSLPRPPLPPEAHGSVLPGDAIDYDAMLADESEDHQEAEDTDPLGLKAVDREIAESRGDAKSEFSPSDPSDAAVEAELEASEPENWTPPAKELVTEGVPLLPPAEIPDEVVTAVLWELLHNLALRGFYVLHTDHVSDRELYAKLWHRGLRDPALMPGRNPRGGWFHDLLGSWSGEELQIWLRFYASDEERTKHATEWPETAIPPKEQRPFTRDWRLPKGPF